MSDLWVLGPNGNKAARQNSRHLKQQYRITLCVTQLHVTGEAKLTNAKGGCRLYA